ncbi:hypothetical protein F4604DRAFT_1768662 [Suillus subluteus]|nr:hypothetical protein F4604DRAFT_1768662 [Suillus subluteus]
MHMTTWALLGLVFVHPQSIHPHGIHLTVLTAEAPPTHFLTHSFCILGFAPPLSRTCRSVAEPVPTDKTSVRRSFIQESERDR